MTASMSVDLYAAAERVDSKESFLAFVQLLAENGVADATGDPDLCGRGPSGWEHHTIEDFLFTISAWGASSSGLTGQPHIPADASWRSFALMLHSGRFYE
jgi:hypothetical protein